MATTESLAKSELDEQQLVQVAPVAPDFEALIGQAINKGDIQIVNSLLAVRDHLLAQAAETEFNAALTRFQGAIPAVHKDSSARIGDKFNYNYASLGAIVDTVRPHLVENGLSYTFDTAFEEPVMEGGRCVREMAQVVSCTITHVGGHSKTSSFRAPVVGGGRMNSVQENASSVTYGKRYTFTNVLGIVTADEDNDAQHAAGRFAPPERAPQTKPPQSRQQAPAPPPQDWGVCPNCGQIGTLRGPKRTGKVYCPSGAGGCGHEFTPDELHEKQQAQQRDSAVAPNRATAQPPVMLPKPPPEPEPERDWREEYRAKNDQRRAASAGWSVRTENVTDELGNYVPSEMPPVEAYDEEGGGGGW